MFLLSPFAKVFEIAMFTHLSLFFKHKISVCQHGFVQGRSVETNLVSYLGTAGPAVAIRGQLDTVYFDLSKAFDVSHGLLIHKLLRCGVSTSLCTLIKGYLSIRLNYVRVGAQTTVSLRTKSLVRYKTV